MVAVYSYTWGDVRHVDSNYDGNNAYSGFVSSAAVASLCNSARSSDRVLTVFCARAIMDFGCLTIISCHERVRAICALVQEAS